jgi:hypothetical protein
MGERGARWWLGAYQSLITLESGDFARSTGHGVRLSGLSLLVFTAEGVSDISTDDDVDRGSPARLRSPVCAPQRRP